MGTIIDEIIDSLKKGQGKRVTDLVKMALALVLRTRLRAAIRLA